MNNITCLLFLLNLYCFFAFMPTAFIQNNRHYLNFDEELTEDDYILSQTNTTIKWIEQPLDHFNEQEKCTWKMRYLENLQLFKPNGPIYLYTSGGYIDQGWLTDMYLWTLANETNGAVFASEYRYYGKSIPSDLTVKNMKFLTTPQALADLAHLIKTIKSRPEFKHSKVVVAGAYHSGRLATWMRLKYPDLVDAAWASTATLLAKQNWHEFLDQGAKNIQWKDARLYNETVETFRRFDELLQSDEGRITLKNENRLCDWNDMTNPLNKAAFIFSKIFAPPLISNVQNKCFSSEFPLIAYVYNIRFRTILYQQCTEFGQFPTSIHKEPYTKNLNLDFYVKTCTLFFGSEFDEKRIDEGVAVTNSLYGGLTPNVTRVVFVYGGRDLYRTLGVLRNLSEEAPAYEIRDSLGYRSDLDIEKPDDSKELKDARRFAKGMIKKWLRLN